MHRLFVLIGIYQNHIFFSEGHFKGGICHCFMVYALAQQKADLNTYNEIINAILEAEPNIKPGRVVVDFELAAIKKNSRKPS